MNAPPDILFMGRIFEVPWGGVREMADALLAAAAPQAEEQGRRIQVLVPRAGLCPVRHPAVVEVPLPRFRSSRLLWDHWTVARAANRWPRPAVLYNIKLVLPLGLRIPGFTTLHDLMYFPQPEKYDWREYHLLDSLYMRRMVPRTVRRAALTHCVSEATARDARALFPDVAPGRFRVIHHGIDAGRFASKETGDREAWAALEARGVRQPYVLYTGGLSRRKNVRVLAYAMARLVRERPELQLVLTGGSKPTTGDPRLRRALHMIPPGNLVRLGTVDSRSLRLLYQRAAVYAFPSLYEGFGFPPLEAQAAGCPVVSSGETSLAEVVGDSALVFDARSAKDCLGKLREALDPGRREELIGRGRANVARFRWEETAREWLELADEVFSIGMKKR